MAVEKILADELISKIKGIQIKAAHLANDVFAGEYASAFKGRGLEFEEVREYLPGDDVRSIDWNVSARFDKPYIKTYRDERELTVVFMVDASASTQFGTQHKFKSEILGEITGLLAYTALRSNDKVGLLIFTDQVELFIPPRKGTAHIWRLIKEILIFQAKRQHTNFAVGLEYLNRCIKRKAIVFLLSDFQEDGYQQQLRAMGKKHDVIALSLYDRKELELPAIGYVEFEDLESGETIIVNTSDRRFNRNFKEKKTRILEAQKSFFRQVGVDLLQIETDEYYLEPIVKFFRLREKRKLR